MNTNGVSIGNDDEWLTESTTVINDPNAPETFRVIKLNIPPLMSWVVND